MLLEAKTEFALDLLRQLSKDDSKQSTVISPASITFALSLLHAGAKGNTQKQLQTVLLNGASNEELMTHYSSMCKSLVRKTDGIDVRVANRFYMADSLQVKSEYLKEILGKYDALAETIDFGNTTAAAGVINGFVNNATNGKIPRLLSPSALTGAVGVLVNAMYMKADWETKFDKKNTKEGDFHVDGAVKKVMFMNESNANRLYFDGGDVQVLTLSYKDPSFEFNIFLPRGELTDFMSSLTGSKLQELLKNLRKAKLIVKIPKMKVEKETNLNDILSAMGLTDIFGGRADLSGIAGGLFISKVLHKALIETDEEGSVAAAATAVVLKRCRPMAPRDPLSFIADRPFLYSITYNRHPLFVGCYYG